MSDLHLKNCIEARKWTTALLSKKVLINDDIEFNVITSCATTGGIIKERIKGRITINGYQGGNIELENGTKYKVYVAPMGFRADCQEYEYDPIKEVLRITGTHPTFRGYIVEMGIG